MIIVKSKIVVVVLVTVGKVVVVSTELFADE
jgi:hypothetical protein